MRIATFNAHDSAAAVRRSLELAGLILWQEYPRGVQASDAHGIDVGGNGTVVTGWRLRWWRHLDSAWHTAHPGRRFVIGGTPARGTLVTKLEHHRGLRVAVVNGHRINRTTGRWRLVPGVQARVRAGLWRIHDDLDRRVVADLVSAGWVVIGGGDYNRRRMRLPHPAARHLAGANSIDKLWLVDPEGRLDRDDAGVVGGLWSDHALRWARL